jgi:hypothetical protein
MHSINGGKLNSRFWFCGYPWRVIPGAAIPGAPIPGARRPAKHPRFNISHIPGQMSLGVAETSAHGNLVTALGTPAAQHGCSGLGLHAGQKPVGFRAMAAIWLEGTLRHWTSLLLNLFTGCNSLPVYLKASAVQKKPAKERAYSGRKIRQFNRPTDPQRMRFSRLHSIFTRNGATQLLTPDHLKTARFSVLTSNPLTKDGIGFFQPNSGYVAVSLRNGKDTTSAKISSENALVSTTSFRWYGISVSMAVSNAVLDPWVCCPSLDEKTWNSNPRRN